MPIGGSFATQARCVLLLMLFCCLFVISSQRINMSIAILNMINWTTTELNMTEYCPSAYKDRSTEDGELDWTIPFQSHVLASYFYGLVLVQLPAELLAEKFSGQYLALIGMVIASFCNFVTPIAAKWNIGSIMYVQMTKAIGHAMVMPAFSVMLGAWIPTGQLVRFMAYGTCGLPVGAFFTVLLGGIICSSPEYRWPFVFYSSGAIGVIWCMFWLYLCFDMGFIPILISSRNPQGTDFPKNNYSVPLKAILMSKPVWGYVAAGVAAYWMIALNILVLPTYLWVVFRIQIEWNGLMSSFPNVLQAFLYLMSFTMSDRVIAKRRVDKTAVRRFVACSGLAIFATCMVLLTFVKCYRALGVLLMMIGVGASGFTLAALSVIPVDMSPNFSGILSGIMNTFGPLIGSALPLMVGYFTDGQRELRNWDKVFYASGFVTFVCMILFMAYSSCAIQPWNNPEEAELTFIDLTASGSQSWIQIPIAEKTGHASTSEQQEGTPPETMGGEKSTKPPTVIDY